MVRQLQRQKPQCSSIPALKEPNDNWVRGSEDKANLLATTLAGKYALAELQINEYSAIEDKTLDWLTDRAVVLHPYAARGIIANLR